MRAYRYAGSLALMVLVILLAGCDTRPILGDHIITLYNADLQETKTFAPMDTMYVRVAALGPEKYYAVSVVDASGRTISRIEMQSDEGGVLGPVPLWYDMGLYKEAAGSPPVLRALDAVDIEAFYVTVQSLTDTQTHFRQPMWIRFKADPAQTGNPRPVVYAAYCENNDPQGSCYPENAFEESGSRKEDGISASDKTKIYVEARRIPQRVGPRDITHVDFYVLPFSGAFLEDRAVLRDYIVKKENVAVGQDGEIGPTLLWNLDDPPSNPQVINPGQDNMAYMIVMDVDQNGRFDLGVDTTRDGLVDDYIDGIDGMGVPGFIIQNTPANDTFITIRDEEGRAVNAIPDKQAEPKHLYFNMDNIALPAGFTLATDTIRIHLIEAENNDLQNLDPIPADSRAGPVPAVSVEPASGLRLLPYAEDIPLLNTRAVAADVYTYGTLPLGADRLLDIVVDLDGNNVFNTGDLHLRGAVTMVYVEPNPEYETHLNMAGTAPSIYFDESGTLNGNTRVYMKVTDMPAGAAPYDVYVVPRRDWADGNTVSGRELFVVEGLQGNGVFEIWDLDTAHRVINPGPDSNTYDLVIDRNRNGRFDAAGDAVIRIVILNTEANTYPRVAYANIASGGVFGNTRQQHWTLYSEFCDYRDVFRVDGGGTNPTGGGYGVKAVFNPYFKWFSNPGPERELEGIYHGLFVDVYIVDADTFDLTRFGRAGELNDTVDVRGRKSTIAIQPSCYNGAGMMTIWRAPLKRGRYYVIVDVDRNGRIVEGRDIIDAVNFRGESILDDPAIVGFSVE
ncbi:hypothetical protein OOT00_10965 [Desulfobotulus sp. H1]|uniref:Lipoprotein n=1 Tax=Desulfobotulus pelophilus TaxID=2823377 RepID=A0ABT3NAL9_9BACT|nr:hypothetical protein [Desulfobotulus pelophilus]MCW7754505.1 hypothetical protein [Desulfobotulus pelophilus]